MKRSYLVLLCSCLCALPSQAQVGLKSGSIGISYWRPSLDYWNKRSMLTDYNNGYGATLSGTVMPVMGLDVNLVGGLSVRGQVSYWKQSVRNDLNAGGNRLEKLTLSIIPVSLGLTYRFRGLATTDPTGITRFRPDEPMLIPFVGVGIARYFIHSAFIRQTMSNPGSVNELQTGNNYGMQVFAGVEKKITDRFYITLDARYHVGNYKQAVRTGVTTRLEKVNLNGIEAGLSLRVKFR